MTLVSREEVYFSKLKTLPKEALQELCKSEGIDLKGKVAELINRLFSHKISESVIEKYIKAEYRKKRHAERDSKGITHSIIGRELNKVQSHVWGMVQGKMDGYIQSNFVRKYYIYNDFLKAVEHQGYPAMQSYCLCTWYNHWSTVVLEDLIAEHPKVVPTVKKVKNVDFFWLGQPWDLKNTNLPKEWFKDGHTFNDAIKNPVLAAKYLYELQGPERFGANNRLFLIIEDTMNPKETWKLKRDFSLIKKSIDNFFNKVTTFDTVNFIYSKKPYVAHSKMLFIVK